MGYISAFRNRNRDERWPVPFEFGFAVLLGLLWLALVFMM